MIENLESQLSMLENQIYDLEKKLEQQNELLWSLFEHLAEKNVTDTIKSWFDYEKDQKIYRYHND